MQHKIIFVSQKDFQEKYNQENDLSNAACISIVDPDEKHKPVISDKWALSLRVEIYDGNTEESSLFTDSNAKNIINFIQSVKELEIELLIIHCYAGISRSAAVAKFASLILNAYFPDYYILYNKFIYSKLLLNYKSENNYESLF